MKKLLFFLLALASWNASGQLPVAIRSTNGTGVDTVFQHGAATVEDTSSQVLNDSNGQTSLQWSGNRFLYDGSGNVALDWNSRRLFDSTGAGLRLDWGGTALSGGNWTSAGQVFGATALLNGTLGDARYLLQSQATNIVTLAVTNRFALNATRATSLQNGAAASNAVPDYAGELGYTTGDSTNNSGEFIGLFAFTGTSSNNPGGVFTFPYGIGAVGAYANSSGDFAFSAATGDQKPTLKGEGSIPFWLPPANNTPGSDSVYWTGATNLTTSGYGWSVAMPYISGGTLRINSFAGEFIASPALNNTNNITNCIEIAMAAPAGGVAQWPFALCQTRSVNAVSGNYSSYQFDGSAGVTHFPFWTNAFRYSDANWTDVVGIDHINNRVTNSGVSVFANLMTTMGVSGNATLQQWIGGNVQIGDSSKGNVGIGSFGTFKLNTIGTPGAPTFNGVGNVYYNLDGVNGELGVFSAGTTNDYNVIWTTATTIVPKKLTVMSGVASTISDTPVAVSVGASPFSYTNLTGINQEFNFTGATAYSVTKNGAAVAGSLAGDFSGKLAPNSKLVVTYTVAPTMFTNAW